MDQSTEGKWEELKHLSVHTPIQVPSSRCDGAPGPDSSVFFPKVAAPWSHLLPSSGQSLFGGSTTPEAGFGAAQTTPDYHEKIPEWQSSIVQQNWICPTPASSYHSTLIDVSPTCQVPSGLPRPQPQKVEAHVEVDVENDEPSTTTGELSPIVDVTTTSAFSVPLPERKKSLEESEFFPQSFVSSGLLENSDQGVICFTPETENGPSAFSAPSSTESAGPSTETTPTSNGFTRAPGLGPPQTPNTSGGNSYVCSICGFSCASKFHYNSHMNTHGDHQCSMCDYTSRTEGRLKKHMRESHTIEEQMAAGLDLSPPSASAPATPAASTTIMQHLEMTHPKDAAESMMDTSLPVSTPENGPSVIVSTSSVNGDSHCLPSPTTLSSALFGMITTSQASSALEQMKAITEKPLISDGSNGGLLLMRNPLAGLELTPSSLSCTPMRKEGERRGKVKQYKCKQCPHISIAKEEQWEHARTHIPSDKQLGCPKCNFVTEYKHHLEYHIRNHLGSKPFQCKKCAYTCVNKSMLNSHMKSHTNVYHFRCADCTYATKYCHSLKLHLKKYGHRRKMDGMEGLESLPIEGGSPTQVRKDSSASMASSLSGPFTPFVIKKEELSSTPVTSAPVPSFSISNLAPITPSQSLTYATQMLMRQHHIEQMMGMGPLLNPYKCNFCEFSCRSHQELMQHNVSHLLGTPGLYGLSLPSSLAIAERSAEDDDTTGSPPGDDAVSHSNASTGSPVGSGRGSGDEDGTTGNGRRKSKAARIDEIGQRLRDKASPDTVEEKQECMDTDEPCAMATAHISIDDHHIPVSSLMEATPPALSSSTQESSSGLGMLHQAYLAHLFNQNRQIEPSWRYECTHCRMGFQDEALHQIHMGYHGYENVFQCNRCGHSTGSSLAFNLHLLQSSHL